MANISKELRPARFPLIFATDFCNVQDPMFTGLSEMMQNLPVMQRDCVYLAE
jgi:hypothetical protein